MCMNAHKRILAIDFGSSKIGLAISDELNITAQPLSIINNDNLLMQNISEIVHNNNIGKIIVGSPSKISNQTVSDFVKILKQKFFSAEIIIRNEDFTTLESKAILSRKTRAKSRRRKNILINKDDAIAAALILASYIENPD